MNSPLIKKYGQESRFVSWKLQERKGKVTKLPYDIFGSLASSTDPETWATYDEVKNFSDNVGIVLKKDSLLLCLDIDKVLNKEGEIEHEQKDIIEQFIKEANSYQEISQSGTGIHIFLEITEPFELHGNKSHPFELYVSGRYIAITENPFKKMKEVRTVTPQEMTDLLKILKYPWKKEELESAHDGQVELPTAQKSTKVDSMLDDSQVLEKMFASKNGVHARALYDGDVSGNKDDHSAADLAFCSHLAFWTQKNAGQMERIWLNSRLGSRKKTQTRKAYRDGTIDKAIKSCKEVYETTSTKTTKKSKELNLDLLFTLSDKKDKIFTQNTENMCRILRKHPNFQGRFHYDVFKNVIEIFFDKKWRTLEDNDAVNIQTEIQIEFSCFGKVGKEMIYDAIIKVAKENTIDSAGDYMRSLVWDGTARLDTWLCVVYGCPSDAYHIAVGSNWLKGLVKRVIDPGSKFDYVLVLEGPQGSKKSTSLAVLANGWHVETTMSTDTKDFFMQFAGNMIIEFSEGETLNRTEVKRMKAIITTQIDKYRPAYGRAVAEFPRRCVFAMTTNDEEYLKDETGNRRWLPVKLMVDSANVEWLELNRDQLYAEALHRLVVKKETVYEFPKDEVLEKQNERRVHYEHEDAIIYWYHHTLKPEQRIQGVTIHQVYRDAMNSGFNNKMLNKFDEMKIADVLRRGLKLTKAQVMIDGIRTRRWIDESVKNLDMKPVVFKDIEEDW